MQGTGSAFLPGEPHAENHERCTLLTLHSGDLSNKPGGRGRITVASSLTSHVTHATHWSHQQRCLGIHQEPQHEGARVAVLPSGCGAGGRSEAPGIIAMHRPRRSSRWH